MFVSVFLELDAALRRHHVGGRDILLHVCVNTASFFHRQPPIADSDTAALFFISYGCWFHVRQ